MDLGLLLGNTTLRVATFDETGTVAGEVVHVPWSAWDQGRRLRPLVETDLDVAIVASVRDDLLGRVEQVLPSRLLPVRVARRDFPVPIGNPYERPAELGTDRLLNALAADQRAGERGSIVVDFGTAISVSVVRGGVFQGGLIAAGAHAVLAGLRIATPKLPGVDTAHRGTFLANDSRAAMATGVYWQIVGGVREILRGLREELGAPRPLILATGGAATVFSDDLPELDAVVSELTCEGLGLAWHAHRKAR